MEDAAKQNDSMQSASQQDPGAEVIFSGELSQDQDVQSVLLLIAVRPEIEHGLLRVMGRDLKGEIAITNGKTIAGAALRSTERTGRAAVQDLLQATKGMYVYCQLGTPNQIHSQQMGLNIMDVTLDPDDEPKEPTPSMVAPAGMTESQAKNWSLEELNKIRTPAKEVEAPEGDKVFEDIERSLQRHRDTKTGPDKGSGLRPAPSFNMEPILMSSASHLPASASSSKNVSSAKESIQLSQLVSKNTTQSLSPKDFVNASSSATLRSSAAPSVRRPGFDGWAWIGGFMGLAISVVLASQLYGAINAKSHMQRGLKALKEGHNTDAYLDFSASIKADPQIKSAYLYRAIASGKNREWDKAIADYDTLIASAPSAIAYTGRACMHLKNKDYESAKNDCDKAHDLDNSYADAYRVRAAAHARLQNYHQAIVDCGYYLKLRKKTADRAELADALGTRALAYLKSGKFDQAIDDYTQAIELEKNNGYLYASRAAAFHGANSYRRAVEDCNKAIPLISTPGSLYQLRALCYTALKQNSRSIDDLDRAIMAQPESLELRRQRGKARLAIGDYKAALDDFHFVLSRNPNDNDARIRFDQASRNMPKGLSASFLRQQLADMTPENNTQPMPIIKGTAAELVKRGYKALQSGDAESAVTLLTAAVKDNPNDPQARRYLAHAMAATGNAKGASAQFRVLASLEALNESDMLAYGKALDSSGARESAIEIFAKCLSANPDCSNARLTLIELYKKASFDDRATALAREGLTRAKSSGEKAAIMDKWKNTAAENQRQTDKGGGLTKGPHE